MVNEENKNDFDFADVSDYEVEEEVEINEEEIEDVPKLKGANDGFFARLFKRNK
jgi:hypothetical protein